MAGSGAAGGSDPAAPYLHDGVLNPGGHHDINAVTWWVLKNRGVALLGPPASQLDIQVDWDGLVAAMHRNMNIYWATFTSNPQRMTWLLGDYGIQWTVLGVLRQFYTFRERAITSKVWRGHLQPGAYTAALAPAHPGRDRHPRGPARHSLSISPDAGDRGARVPPAGDRGV